MATTVSNSTKARTTDGHPHRLIGAKKTENARTFSVCQLPPAHALRFLASSHDPVPPGQADHSVLHTFSVFLPASTPGPRARRRGHRHPCTRSPFLCLLPHRSSDTSCTRCLLAYFHHSDRPGASPAHVLRLLAFFHRPCAQVERRRLPILHTFSVSLPTSTDDAADLFHSRDRLHTFSVSLPSSTRQVRLLPAHVLRLLAFFHPATRHALA
jgi:hypothetical protein